MAMASSPEPRRSRRGAAAFALVVVLVAVGAVLVTVRPTRGRSTTAADRYAVPADLRRRDARPTDPVDPVLTAMAETDRAREHLAVHLVHGHAGAFLPVVQPDPAVRPTLVLPGRPKPYDLAALAHQVPAAFQRLDDGALVLLNPLLLAHDATLVVDSDTVPALRLSSGPAGYATITAVRATVILRGHPGRPLDITSFDPTTGGPDLQRKDGRAYVLDRGGRMDLRHVAVSRLGYANTGESSGVAWTADIDHPATGAAIDSTFSHNYFGAYTAGAEGLEIIRSSFLDNVIYGFDPHTATNDTVVSHSVAARNGRHGFIFSEGCERNVVRDSEAFLNGGAGFMIDDGTPAHGLGRPSDGNTLLRVSSHDNGDAGVVIEGGVDNQLRGSTVVNNEYGVWVRNGAAGTKLVHNTIVATERTAVRLAAGLGPIGISGVEVRGAKVGVGSDGGSATDVRDLRISGTTSAGIRLEGDQAHARFADVVISRSGAEGLDVRGTSPRAAQLAGIDGARQKAAAVARWGLASALHRSVLTLWALILLLPLLSKVPLGLQRRRTQGSPSGAAGRWL